MLQSLILALGGVGSTSLLLALRGRSLIAVALVPPFNAVAGDTVINGASAGDATTFKAVAGDE